MSIQEVVGALLQNIGSMCLHQLHSDVLQWPMGSYVLQQQPCDLMHLMRITTILRRAMDARDTQSAVCCLVVLQVGLETLCSSLLFLQKETQHISLLQILLLSSNTVLHPC